MTMINQSENLNKIFLFGFLSFPFLLVSGPLLPEIFIFISCIYFLFINGVQISFEKYRKEVIFFLIFFTYLNFNTLFVSESKLLSAKVSITYFRYFLFSFFLVYILTFNQKIKFFFFYSCLICLSILLFDSFYQLINKTNILGYPINGTRVSSFFNDELILGSFASKIIIIMLAISFCFDSTKKKTQYIFFTIFLIGYALILMSNERTSLAYLIVVFLFFCLIELNLKKFILIILSFIVLNIFIQITYPKAFDRVILYSVEQFKNSKGIFLSSYRHNLHYFTAFQMFKEKPFTGHGLKSFRILCSKPSYKVYEKILEDKAVYAPIDGYIKRKGHKLFLTNKEQLGEDFYIGNENQKMNLKKNFFDFDKIKKGDYLGVYYEFKNGCNTHPHNTHFQFLSTLGLIGYIFLLATILFIIKELFKIFKKKVNKEMKINKYDKAYFICLIGVLIQINPLTPSGSFFNNYNSILFFTIVSFLIYFKNIRKT